MKLSYRGANYEYDIPTVDMLEGDVAGKYRGQNWNYRYPRHIPTLMQGGSPTTYRGVQYSRYRDPNTEEAHKVAKNTCKEEPAAVTSLAVEAARIHRTNICNILDRRKQAAAAKGDERLMRLLEKEWEQMVC